MEKNPEVMSTPDVESTNEYHLLTPEEEERFEEARRVITSLTQEIEVLKSDISQTEEQLGTDVARIVRGKIDRVIEITGTSGGAILGLVCARLLGGDSNAEIALTGAGLAIMGGIGGVVVSSMVLELVEATVASVVSGVEYCFDNDKAKSKSALRAVVKGLEDQKQSHWNERNKISDSFRQDWESAAVDRGGAFLAGGELGLDLVTNKNGDGDKIISEAREQMEKELNVQRLSEEIKRKLT